MEWNITKRNQTSRARTSTPTSCESIKRFPRAPWEKTMNRLIKQAKLSRRFHSSAEHWVGVARVVINKNCRTQKREERALLWRIVRGGFGKIKCNCNLLCEIANLLHLYPFIHGNRSVKTCFFLQATADQAKDGGSQIEGFSYAPHSRKVLLDQRHCYIIDLFNESSWCCCKQNSCPRLPSPSSNVR